MKKLLLILILSVSLIKVFGQQLPVKDRTNDPHVLADRNTWSRTFLGVPHGPVPSFPPSIPDSLKGGALWNKTTIGQRDSLKIYDLHSGAWTNAVITTYTGSNGINLFGHNFTLDTTYTATKFLGLNLLGDKTVNFGSHTLNFGGILSGDTSSLQLGGGQINMFVSGSGGATNALSILGAEAQLSSQNRSSVSAFLVQPSALHTYMQMLYQEGTSALFKSIIIGNSSDDGIKGIQLTDQVDSVGARYINPASYKNGLSDSLSLPPLYIVRQLIAGSNTIYTSDGTLSDNRTINQAAHNILFSNTDITDGTNVEMKQIGSVATGDLITYPGGAFLNGSVNGGGGDFANIQADVNGASIATASMQVGNGVNIKNLQMVTSTADGIQVWDGIDNIGLQGVSLFPVNGNPNQYAQYGNVPSLTGSYSNPSWIASLAWSKITGTPTTLAGYGITDAQSKLTGPGYVKQVSGSPTYVTAIPNADLANSAITLNGTLTSLGGSFTVTKNNTDTTATGFQTVSGMYKKADSARLYTVQAPSVWVRKGVAMTNAQEASVLIEGNPQILTGATTVFKLWYTIGFGGTPTIGYAESLTGMPGTWTQYSGGAALPGLPNGAHSKVFKSGSTYYITITINSGANIALYSSSDGITWSVVNSSILALGGAGTWDSTAFGNTSVLVEGSTWHMIYEAKGTEFAIGGATSTNSGVTWTKNGQIITNMFLGGPDLHKIGSVYYLWVHTTKLPSYGRRFRSTDLSTWVQDPANPTTIGLTADEGAGSALAQVCDLELAEYNGSVYQFYTANPNGSVSYSGGVEIKVAVAPMTFTTLITTTEDGPRSMDVNGASFTNGDDVKMRGKIGATATPNYTGVDNGLYVVSSESTNLIGGISQGTVAGNGLIYGTTKNVGITTQFDGTPGSQNFVNNGNTFYYGTPGVANNEVAKKGDLTSFISGIIGTANQITVSTASGVTTLSLPNSITIGTGAANSQFIVNGAASGSNNGASIPVQNNGTTIIDIGNKSNILGGAYDATPTIYAASPISITQSINVTGTTSTTVYTVSALSALLAGKPAGIRAFVSDASSPSWGNIVTGGGSTVIPVYWDGTNLRAG